MSSTVTHSHTPHALRSCAGIGRPAWPAAVGRAHHRPAAPVRGRLPSPPPWQGTTGQHRNCMSISVLPPYQAGHLQGQHHQLCVASIFPVPAAAGGAYRGRHHKCMASLPRRRRRQGKLGQYHRAWSTSSPRHIGRQGRPGPAPHERGQRIHRLRRRRQGRPGQHP